MSEMTLQRLCDDLDEALVRSNSFGFGLIVTEPAVSVATGSVWNSVARLIPSKTEGGALILETGSIILDPFPDGTGCIRWFGDANGIAAFQEWAGRAGRILSDLEIIPEHTTTKEVPNDRFGRKLVIGDPLLAGGKPYRMLEQLALALKQECPEFVEQIMLDSAQLGSAEQQRKIGVPIMEGKPVTFSFLRLPPLQQRAISSFKKLCRLRGEPRLAVDVKNLTVTLDGLTYPLDHEHVLVLESIISGGGNPVSRKTMQDRHASLALNDRLDRKIDDLKQRCPEVYELIARIPRKGYSISKAYLE